MTTVFWSHKLSYKFGSMRLLLISWLAVMITTQSTPAEEIDVWLGTSSAKPSLGIYHCTLDQDNGKLSESRLAAEMDGPGFLALHPKLNVLYAVGGFNGKASVVAYAISREAGKPQLKVVNSLEIGDGGAAHVSVDATGKTLLTAQYGGGSVATFALEPDGSLKERTGLIEHQGGSKVVNGRQDSPHPHWTGFSPDNRFAFVPDLGLDQVVIYAHDPATARLTPSGIGKAPAGAGPRHMKFHSNGRWIYLLNELDLSVSVFDYDAQTGAMSLRQTIPTVAKSELAKEQFTSAAEICVHPSGKFIYASNRGHDTVTAFSVDESNGELTTIELEPIRGATPRNINLNPAGQWLLAAGQDSHTLSCFKINPTSGQLTYNQSVIQTPAPICVLFDSY